MSDVVVVNHDLQQPLFFIIVGGCIPNAAVINRVEPPFRVLEHHQCQCFLICVGSKSYLLRQKIVDSLDTR